MYEQKRFPIPLSAANIHNLCNIEHVFVKKIQFIRRYAQYISDISQNRHILYNCTRAYAREKIIYLSRLNYLLFTSEVFDVCA